MVIIRVSVYSSIIVLIIEDDKTILLYTVSQDNIKSSGKGKDIVEGRRFSIVLITSRSASSFSTRSSSSILVIPLYIAYIIFSNYSFFCFQRRQTHTSTSRQKAFIASTSSSRRQNQSPIFTSSLLERLNTSYFERLIQIYSKYLDELLGDTR